MLLQGKCKGNTNAQIYAEARWEMGLKALGDYLSRTYGFGNALRNAQRGSKIFSAMLIEDTLWEMPKQKWRPDGRISLQVSSQ
jgi:hypothetical protein